MTYSTLRNAVFSFNSVLTSTILTKGTILEGENDALKEEAGKMDDIIDQNLITLIDSVEAF